MKNMKLPKFDPAKIRSGVRTGSVILDKKTKSQNYRKRKHKKLDNSQEKWDNKSMKFFHFNQNNSGGSFTGPANHVVVEAENAYDANYRAESEVYFDGCDDGLDCPCCGDRWSRQWSDETGDDVPMVYGSPVLFNGENHVLVVYANGEQKFGGY